MRIHPSVFLISAIVILAFIFLGVRFTEATGDAFAALQDSIVESFGWFYVLAVTFFLLFVLWLFVSPFGKVRLGKDDERPVYTNTSWFAMLFSAGMGIGLLFFGVVEPVSHFVDPPDGAPGGTLSSAEHAMKYAFLHWGLYAWSIYIVVGLPMAYFAYRQNLPLSIRSTLYPVLGLQIHGRLGDMVDVLAVFGTVFGIATSLGLGAMQINSGLDYLGVLNVSTVNQIVIIGAVTAAAAVSAASGVNRGVLRLSQMNIGLALLLLVFVLVAGPTTFLLSSFVEAAGRYIQHLPELTLRTDAFQGLEWQKRWTMFYWGWWISWSPFVGIFIARVSRGRTIREFIAGTLLVPTLFTFAWMVVFGNTAIHQELTGGVGIARAINTNIASGLFVLLGQLPLAGVIAAVATLLIATFFVTSADSGSLVVDQLTSGGALARPVPQRVFWALVLGAVAVVLLLTGGLTALQTAAITTALPFCLIMLLMCRSLVKALYAERVRDRTRTVTGEPAMQPGPEMVGGAGDRTRVDRLAWLRRGVTAARMLSRPGVAMYRWLRQLVPF